MRIMQFHKLVRRCPQTAFTLTEVLIVVAILAVIMALVLPVFARAREKSRQTTCLNNLKQLGQATLQYVQDYDEQMYPYEYNGPSGPGDRITWEYYSDYVSTHPNDYKRGLLYPYVKNENAFHCPDAAGFEGVSGGNSGSYGLNTYLSVHLNGTEATGIPLSSAEANAETILITDAASVSNGKLHGNDIIDSPGGGARDVHGLHNQFANVVWLDAHVKAMKPVCGKITAAGCFIDSLDLGTILRGPYTGDKKLDDYYYELVKPN